MSAYIESYLKDVMRNVGVLSHFCINEYGLTPDKFAKLFANSHVAKQISNGNPRFLVGLSGKEMADMIIEASDEKGLRHVETDIYHISPEYWAGWVMAYYQWYTAKSFAQMYSEGQTYDRVLMLYHPMHEADLTKVVDCIYDLNKRP